MFTYPYPYTLWTLTCLLSSPQLKRKNRTPSQPIWAGAGVQLVQTRRAPKRIAFQLIFLDLCKLTCQGREPHIGENGITLYGNTWEQHVLTRQENDPGVAGAYNEAAAIFIFVFGTGPRSHSTTHGQDFLSSSLSR